MLSKFGILVIAALACAASAAPPCICTRNFLPVCGSDGTTYPNECLLECAQQQPGSDIKKVKDGPCTEVASCICTMDYKPVCGEDGNTYPNACGARCANARVSHNGECQNVLVAPALPPCTCNRQKKPVCGSDGKTYSNDCLLNCATIYNSRLSIAHAGACMSEAMKVAEPNLNACTCTRNLSPVCGADGVTYNNQCLLECVGAQKAKEGPCEA